MNRYHKEYFFKTFECLQQGSKNFLRFLVAPRILKSSAKSEAIYSPWRTFVCNPSLSTILDINYVDF